MKLTIMDYNEGAIHIYHVPELADKQNEEVEEWIVENTELKLSEIYYMTTDEIVIHHH